MAPIESPEAVKTKKEKKDKSAKKRAREEEVPADTERKHKKSKSVADTETNPEQDGAVSNGEMKAETKDKKKKKSKHVEDETTDRVKSEKAKDKKDKKRRKLEEVHGAPARSQDVETPAPSATEEASPKKSKKSKKSADIEPDPALADAPSEAVDKHSKKKKKSKKHSDDKDDATTTQAHQPNDEEQHTVIPDPDAMDVDTAASSKPASGKIYQPSDIPSNPQFPFFTQTVSLCEPLYPNGWAKPITGCESQHLRHLKNRYVPSLRGVLLDYSKLSVGENPGRAGAAADDESHAVLKSRNEFGGGFGWITAEVKLFVPSRGAWMEGSVNLQTEGHIGVVCFGKFNASIEARRLPPSWKWVSNEGAEDGFEETASVITGADEHGVVRQIHSTGYWVAGSGEKIRGKVRFRIRNFDVGVSGNSTFLSLQGTMLDKKGEKKLVETEAREARERKERKGGRGVPRRAVPDFSMTRFADEEEEQMQAQAATGEEAREAKMSEE